MGNLARSESNSSNCLDFASPLLNSSYEINRTSSLMMPPATCSRSPQQPVCEDTSEVPESRNHSTKSLAVLRQSMILLWPVLVRYHQTEIPFEDLNAYCYPSPMLNLSEHDVYNTIVGSGRGRGGPCALINKKFSIVLQSLGFRDVDTGARVNQTCQAIVSTQK